MVRLVVCCFCFCIIGYNVNILEENLYSLLDVQFLVVNFDLKMGLEFKKVVGGGGEIMKYVFLCMIKECYLGQNIVIGNIKW